MCPADSKSSLGSAAIPIALAAGRSGRAPLLDSLIGGWVYLHPEGKASPSEFGGVVLRVEPAKRDGKAVEDGYALIFEARKEGRGQAWRGSSHGMAWTGGIIDAASTHEA